MMGKLPAPILLTMIQNLTDKVPDFLAASAHFYPIQPSGIIFSLTEEIFGAVLYLYNSVIFATSEQQ